ncbi:MAG: ExeA family protein [Planctomycetaceae bacterium]
MYESFFGLNRRPFGSAPDLESFVAVETAQDALAELIRCVRAGEGIGVLTAPAGLGKSLLCRRLAAEICASFATIIIPSANFATRRSMLQAILYELDRPYRQMDEQELRLELTTAIRDYSREYEAVAMIFDEAHLLSARLLEEIRAITNLIGDGVPLVRVVLSGQLSLEEKMAEPELSALNQRIGCQVILTPLSQRESADYIRQRLQFAGATRDIFSPDARQVLCQAADGSPRCLNQLADHSLMLGYLANEKSIGAARVREALGDLKQLPLHWNISTAMQEPLQQLSDEAKRTRETQDTSPSAADIDDLRSARQTVDYEAIEIGESEPVASFEFGGDDVATSKPAVAENSVDRLRSIGRAMPAPAADLRTQQPSVAAAFEEEVVVDRYAKLDAVQPQLAKRNLMQSNSKPIAKPAKVVPSQKVTTGTHPTAEELDQRIEGLILMIDDALANESIEYLNSPIGSDDVSFDGSVGVTVSVDVDAVHGVRVQPQASPAPVATSKRATFDVVLPEDDGTRRPSRNSMESQDPHLQESVERAPRPYEQLFSEIRRRKGA